MPAVTKKTVNAWLRERYEAMKEAGTVGSRRQFAAFLGLRDQHVTVNGWLDDERVPTKKKLISALAVAARDSNLFERKSERDEFMSALARATTGRKGHRGNGVDPLVAVSSGAPLTVEVIHAPPFAAAFDASEPAFLDGAFRRFALFANLKLRPRRVDFAKALDAIAAGAQRHVVLGLLCTVDRLLRLSFCTCPVRLGINFITSGKYSPEERERIRAALTIDSKDHMFRDRIEILTTKGEVGSLFVERLLGVAKNVEHVGHDEVEYIAKRIRESATKIPVVRVADEFSCARLINKGLGEDGVLLYDPVRERGLLQSYFLGFGMGRTGRTHGEFSDCMRQGFELYVSSDAEFIASEHEKLASSLLQEFSECQHHMKRPGAKERAAAWAGYVLGWSNPAPLVSPAWAEVLRIAAPRIAKLVGVGARHSPT